MPVSLVMVVMGWPAFMEASKAVPAFMSAIGVVLTIYIVSGVSMLVGFGIVKIILDKYMINKEMFDQVISGNYG